MIVIKLRGGPRDGEEHDVVNECVGFERTYGSAIIRYERTDETFDRGGRKRPGTIFEYRGLRRP